jgi:hypothetical protein
LVEAEKQKILDKETKDPKRNTKRPANLINEHLKARAKWETSQSRKKQKRSSRREANFT